MDSESTNERPIPLGLRYIAYDQWLLTHIQPSCKISHIKLFALSKCLGTNYSVPAHRQPSPITFAPRNPTTPTPVENEQGGEDDDANKPFVYHPRTLPTDTTSPPPAAFTLIRFSTGQILEDSFPLSAYDISPHELLELHGEHAKSMTKPVFPPRRNSFPPSHTPPPSPLLSSSSSTRLMKRIVCLDRTDVHAYVKPYWEGWVKALRVVNRDDLDMAVRSQVPHPSHYHRKTGAPSVSGASSALADRDPSIFGGMSWGFGGVGGMGMGVGFGVVLDEEVLKLRDEDVVPVLSGKKKGGKLSSKVKLEWKERWVVVQGDTLHICKDREDVNPSQRVSLSSLVNIRDKDFLLSYPSPATSPFVPTFTPPDSDPNADGLVFDSPSPGKKGKDKLNNHSKYVICARFRSTDDGNSHPRRGRPSMRPDDPGSPKPKTKNKVKEKTGEDKSQRKKQKLKGSSYGDLSYYSPLGVAAAAGVVLPLPSPERASAALSDEDDHRYDTPGTTTATTTPAATRPSTAAGQITRIEDIYSSPIPTADDTQDDEETQPLISFRTPTSFSTGLTSTTSLSPSDSMPSPLFAHTSDSEWEKDIFGQSEKKKQPFYHNGYQPAYRWKESSEYERARDVWEEGPVDGVKTRRGKKGKGKEKDLRRAYHEYEWIILDMGGSSAFNSILRVLHRGAPAAASTFRTNYIVKKIPRSCSTPTQRGRPPRTSFHSLSSDDDDDHLGLEQDVSRLTCPQNLSERLGVMPYPEWRINITKRAQRAALGNISDAMLFYLFKTLEFADLSSSSSTMSAAERPKSQRSKRSQRLRAASAASTATAASSSAPSDDIQSSHFELDIGSSSDESSEVEWHGWILDIPRQDQVQQQLRHRHEDTQALGSDGQEMSEFDKSEAMRSGTATPRDIIRPSSSRHAEQKSRDRGQPILPPLPSSVSSSRSVGSPPFSSPEPELSPSPPPPSLTAARKRLASMKSTSFFKSSDVPSHLISRRRPSMPQLSFEHPSATSEDLRLPGPSKHVPVGHGGRRRVKGSSPPDGFGEFSSPTSAGAGSGGSTSGPSQFLRRRASAAGLITSGLAGSFGRSANFFGLWKKEKEKDTLREDSGAGTGQDEREFNNNNNKKGKGKGKGKVKVVTTFDPDGGARGDQPHPEPLSREGGTASPTAVGINSMSSVTSVSGRLQRVTSGSATSPEEDEEEVPGLSPMVRTKSERAKLKKRGRLVYEMEKIARGFDGD